MNVRLLLALFVVTAGIVGGCMPIRPIPQNVAQRIPTEPIPIVTTFWEKAAAGDLDAAMQFVDENAVFAMVPGVWAGRDEVRSLLETMRENDADVRVTNLTELDGGVRGRFELWLGDRLYYVADPGRHRIEGGLITYSGSPNFDVAEALVRAPQEPVAELDLTSALGTQIDLPAGQHPYAATVVYSDTETLEPVTETVRFLLYLPPAYGDDPAQRWPLILFLHGSGERGSHLNLLTRHPLPASLAAGNDLPAIVVSPQLPTAPLYADSWRDHLEAVLALLRRLETTLAVDEDRVTATGLSLGGEGTWLMGLRDPHRFAALAPVAAYYAGREGPLPATLFYLKDVPVWAWHGAADSTVSPAASTMIVQALRDLGGDARITLVPDGDHEAGWRAAYASEEFLQWLLSQRRR